jgi:hypothetical protein
MRGKLRLALIGLVTVVAMGQAAPLQAADSKGVYAVRGVGGEGCKAFNDQLKKDPQATMAAASWIMGYVTAANRMQPNTFDLSPVLGPTPLLRLLAGYCEKHPDQGVEKAFSQILRALAVAHNKTESPIVETKSGKYSGSLRAETLIAMQTKLTDYGYFKGRADGIYGPRVETALKTFQKDQKLPETGVADAPTIIRLLVELPPKKK